MIKQYHFSKIIFDEIQSLDVKISFIQTLIPFGLKAVEETLKQEVTKLAGLRYRHTDDKEAYRWGRQTGSVCLTDQKVPLDAQG